MIGSQEFLVLVLVFAVLLGGPWIIRRLKASFAELRSIGSDHE